MPRSAGQNAGDALAINISVSPAALAAAAASSSASAAGTLCCWLVDVAMETRLLLWLARSNFSANTITSFAAGDSTGSRSTSTPARSLNCARPHQTGQRNHAATTAACCCPLLCPRTAHGARAPEGISKKFAPPNLMIFFANCFFFCFVSFPDITTAQLRAVVKSLLVATNTVRKISNAFGQLP